jgi:hypothetical protein
MAAFEANDMNIEPLTFLLTRKLDNFPPIKRENIKRAEEKLLKDPISFGIYQPIGVSSSSSVSDQHYHDLLELYKVAKKVNQIIDKLNQCCDKDKKIEELESRIKTLERKAPVLARSVSRGRRNAANARQRSTTATKTAKSAARTSKNSLVKVEEVRNDAEIGRLEWEEDLIRRLEELGFKRD